MSISGAVRQTCLGQNDAQYMACTSGHALLAMQRAIQVAAWYCTCLLHNPGLGWNHAEKGHRQSL